MVVVYFLEKKTTKIPELKKAKGDEFTKKDKCNYGKDKYGFFKNSEDCIWIPDYRKGEIDKGRCVKKTKENRQEFKLKI